jgi:hypothetical protein
MKKLLMTLAALAVIISLSAPAFADKGTSSSKGRSSGGTATSSGSKPQPH